MQIPYRRPDGPVTLLIDSTGIKFRGDGEWQARKHGASRRRQWRKVHIGMDAQTGDVRAIEFTSSRQGDSPLLPELLAQLPEEEKIGSVTADGAYDTRRCHCAIATEGPKRASPFAAAVVPGRKTLRRLAFATRSCARRGASGGPVGSVRQAITSEVGSRRR